MRRFAAPARHARRDAKDLRRALPAARADPRLHQRRSVGIISAAASSVHLQLFPESAEAFRDKQAQEQVTELLKLRGVIGQAIEKARQEKLIGNALEAAVILHCDANAIAGVSHEELEEFFILSDLKIEIGRNRAFRIVTKTAYKKCARCWRHRSSCRDERGASRFVRSLRGRCLDERRCAMNYLSFRAEFREAKRSRGISHYDSRQETVRDVSTSLDMTKRADA